LAQGSAIAFSVHPASSASAMLKGWSDVRVILAVNERE
jgi:hypothetical protein